MIYHPNRVSIAPVGGDYDGDFWVERAVAHPGLLFVPRLREEMPPTFPGIEGVINQPPQSVVDAHFTSTWRVEANISSPAGIGLSVSDVAGATLLSGGDIDAALERGVYISGSWKNGDPPDAWCRLDVDIASGEAEFFWIEGKWWPGLSVFYSSRGGEGYQFYNATLGWHPGVSDPETGLSVEFAGQQWMAFGDAGVSGTLTITPEDYLSLP